MFEMRTTSHDWRVAARFLSTGEAEAAASALDAAGIELVLSDQNLVGVNWEMAQAVGGVKVLVNEDDLELAREILFSDAHEQAVQEPISGTPEVQTPIVCPQCGLPDFAGVPRVRIFLLLAAVFLGIGIAVDQPLLALTALVAVAVGVLLMPSARCIACLYRWSPPPQQHSLEALPPSPSDMIEECCPRCGSFEVYLINDRRLKAIPLLFPASIFAVLPLWLVLPKRRCDSCGLKLP